MTCTWLSAATAATDSSHAHRRAIASDAQLEDIVDDWKYLDDRIERVTDEIEALARTDLNCRQLMTVPGIGPIIASATVAAIGNGAGFAKRIDTTADCSALFYKGQTYARCWSWSVRTDPGAV